MSATLVSGSHGTAVRLVKDVPGFSPGLSRVIGNDLDLQGDFSIGFDWRWTGQTTNPSATFTYHNPALQYPWKLTVARLGSDLFRMSLGMNVPDVGNPEVIIQYDYELDDSVWHSLAITYDRAGDVILYFEGVEVNSLTAPNADLTIASNVNSRLEADALRGSPGASFELDNVWFTNTVLPPETIADYATNGLPGD